MDETLAQELNQRLNDEMYSAYKYLAMSAYFSEVNLHGFAKYMSEQAKEEMEHGQRVYEYLLLRNVPVKLMNIEASNATWINPLDVFEEALAHEKNVTQKYNHFFEHAGMKKDHALMLFLKWFVEEQVEEESTFTAILEKIKAVQSCPCGIFHMDKGFLG
jgi:ferritin